mmetsp:Transcript_16239/g.25117  ORF Transcript_16239/g.25117 Transcript_16239/m.25117 type:complete len:92 (-) Transcript_16239:192-467(-)|eukprot:CAMPEP_0170508890 /NCGR_PEP_ID=MMETSP0208-20121228/63753_1 /TAXON_ID=197538 /ORGANISM="Strombidium inclinatum, Strain S3" /LENGTH=91 /DNA_ID=CAMNT_0010792043 /DNA_START=280 /DNA_END=555 /DNA_ORIENTATION=-
MKEKTAENYLSFYESIQCVYVTFKSMETKELADRLYAPKDLLDREKNFLQKFFASLMPKTKANAKQSVDEAKLTKWRSILQSSNLIMENAM